MSGLSVGTSASQFRLMHQRRFLPRGHEPCTNAVDWFNTRRLLEPIGYVPPAEYEARYYQQAAVA